MVILIEGIEAFTAERDSVNEAPKENLPTVLTHELVKLHGVKFTAIIRKKQEWLQELVSAVEADKIEQDFQELKLVYQTKKSFKMILINMTRRQHYAKAGILLRHVLSNWETSAVG
jgi:hypothetical protein